MATPVGDPNVSLLPQPATPVPIEPMRGGGSENISLLPQPSEPVPIIPMKGGALQGTLQKFAFLPKTKQLQPFQEKKFKFQRNVNAYITTRQELWGDDVADYDFFETVDKIVLPKLNDIKSKATIEQIAKLPASENLYIFFVINPDQLAKILYTIKTDIEFQSKKEIFNNYILIDATDNSKQNTFTVVFKNIIEFIYQQGADKDKEERQNIFFLFNKQGKQLVLDSRELSASKTRKAVFQYLINLEPSYVVIPYQVKGEERSLVFTALNKKPAGYPDSTVVLSASKEPAKKLDLGKDKIQLDSLEKNTIYSLKSEDYLSHYIYLTFEDVENNAVPPPATTTAPPVVTSPPVIPPPSATTPPPVNTPPPSAQLLPPVSYVISAKEEIQINLGGSIFTIRNVDAQTLKDWNDLKFNESEQKLFEEIGIDNSFLTENLTERKKDLLKKRGEFLKTLALSNCFLDTTFLLRRECEFSRDFLAELYELKQIDRIKAVTSAFSDVFAISLDIKAKPLVDKILDTLPGLDLLLTGLGKQSRKQGIPAISGFSDLFKSGSSSISSVTDTLNIDKILQAIVRQQRTGGPINISNVLSPQTTLVVPALSPNNIAIPLPGGKLERKKGSLLSFSFSDFFSPSKKVVSSTLQPTLSLDLSFISPTKQGRQQGKLDGINLSLISAISMPAAPVVPLLSSLLNTSRVTPTPLKRVKKDLTGFTLDLKNMPGILPSNTKPSSIPPIFQIFGRST